MLVKEYEWARLPKETMGDHVIRFKGNKLTHPLAIRKWVALREWSGLIENQLSYSV